ncbi:MAG: ABC transporter substrate-binding protein, partial [Planctomycetes bacterium]|nr:ABC transporter substrate-binding protein [Planctomycetota bacterium]
LHQVTLRPQPFARYTVESREIGHVGEVEFHTVLTGNLSPAPGDEALAFAITGPVYQLVPEGDAGAFVLRQVADVGGRVRDAVVVPGAGGAATILGVSRRGDLLSMRLGPRGLEHRVLLHEDSGLGRICRSPTMPGVFYVTRDDGVLLRVALGAGGAVDRQVVLATEQGLRGVAAGRFFADGRESVAVYGYGKKVQLVSRAAGASWQVEDLYCGVQKGHWLVAGELDGRNGTDELLATGFDGEMIVLAREPGYALPGVAVPAPEPKAKVVAGPAAPRIWAHFGDQALTELSPLRYQGGFETKSLVYETLVQRDAAGRIAPGLATAWHQEDGGKAFVFTLREGATFHDGAPVTAAAVALHFRRWIGLPEHDWLRSSRHIVAARATTAGELRIDLDQPWALLPDLCAVNPTAVRGQGALDREGNFVRPVGTGPFAFVAARENGAVLRFRRVAEDRECYIDLVRGAGDPIDALLREDVDAVVGSWLVPVNPARAAALRSDPSVQVGAGPGSSMVFLGLRWDRGPLQALPVRRAVAAAIDRAELVEVVMHGFADASTGWAAPSIVDWPQGQVPSAAAVTLAAPLLLVAAPRDRQLADVLAAQLQRHGLPCRVELAEGKPDVWDLRIERTHGVPYDPFTTVVSRFSAPLSHANASLPSGAPVDAELAQLVGALAAAPDEAARPQLFTKIQHRLDELLPIVPLFAPQRIAVVRAGLPMPRLDHDMYRLDPDWLSLMVLARN